MESKIFLLQFFLELFREVSLIVLKENTPHYDINVRAELPLA